MSVGIASVRERLRTAEGRGERLRHHGAGDRAAARQRVVRRLELQLLVFPTRTSYRPARLEKVLFV